MLFRSGRAHARRRHGHGLGVRGQRRPRPALLDQRGGGGARRALPAGGIRARLSGARGGVTTELVLVTPTLLLLPLLIVFAGRLAPPKGRVTKPPRDSARAAPNGRASGGGRE